MHKIRNCKRFASTKQTQISLEMLASNSSIGDGVRSGLRSLRVESGPDFNVAPISRGTFGRSEMGARSLDLRAGLHFTTFLISARCNLQFEIFIIVSLHFAKLCCEKRPVRALILSLGPGPASMTRFNE